ncbi:hypothetical protein E1212_19505 [Jiangella ureilytica]|uniref:Uncharacterized protein n=1 Tax=Jiangella ureilytica TaxID=2530374 RepID=A0A4R4RI81_9ACTN|nr:hypothetical protein [Jiangella ureilytica]TDC49044.1 hypothetical protein E1212_19505 [Jiangella ureilytica]
MSDEARWREQRREAIQAHADALARKQAAETQRARALVAEFVAAMRSAGIEPGPLRARAGEGAVTYRTGLRGWYVRRNRAMAVGEDGAFYLLDVPRSAAARLAGVRVAPSDPPLQVGVGARDGESMPLERLLRQRLEAGSDF